MDEISKQLFERTAEWKCARVCDRPATHVIEWQHQDGDLERRILCQEHAVEDQKYWSAMDWHTCVEVSDIEEWELSVSSGGKMVTRVGNLFCQALGRSQPSSRGRSGTSPPCQPTTHTKEKDLDRIERTLCTSFTRFTGRDRR